MENIINIIKTFFGNVDKRDWETVKELMRDTIFLDYSSINGNPATELSSSEVVSSWASFLPGFERTNHQIFYFKETKNENDAEIYFGGKAEHFIKQDIWVVEGSYNVKLILENEKWLISSLKFNFDKQYGNLELPTLASERMEALK